MTAATHLDVYRLEHTGPTCEVPDAHHGPFMRAGCRSTFNLFGLTGHSPGGQRRDHHRCGVTAKQARYWWEVKPTPEHLQQWTADGWGFVHYRVPVGQATETRGQILFRYSDKHRVGAVGFPRYLLTDNRTNYDSRERFHHKHIYVTRPARELVSA